MLSLLRSKYKMRTIIHLSDLHFGKVDKKRIAPLLSIVNELNPDLVVISGDLTQRATSKEYAEAREFIKQIKGRIFVIPGNHDIPLYNIYARIAKPFKKYTEFVTPDLSPIYIDEEVAVVGINSVRRFTITSGRISKKQIEGAEKIFSALSADVVKIVVCHHPFDLPHSKNTHHKHTHKVIGRSKFAMSRLAEKKVDLFLSGHLHVTHVGDTTMRYKIDGYSGLIVQAGTAISSRSRGEPVSFNVIRVGSPDITIESYHGEAESPGFAKGATYKFKNEGKGWRSI